MSGISTPRRAVILGLAAASLTACGRNYSKLPPADHVMVLKAERRLLLLQQQQPVREFRVGLGFAPDGTKQVSGDGKTPEGRYFVDRKNPQSAYHLSLGINYPTPEDMARAQAMGIDPGGDIFIHGEPNSGKRRNENDWTAGCIAVRNREIEEIYSRVPLGTPVTILA